MGGGKRDARERCRYSEAKVRLMSAKETARPRFVNVPCSAISFAACRKPVHAERASAPPTLIVTGPIGVGPAGTFRLLGEFNT
jgi:hypothetical protein